MAITFTWEFPHWCYSQKPINGFDGVITEINWRLTASDGTNKKQVFGKFTLDPPAAGSKDFISKETLKSDPAKLKAWLVQQAESSPKVGYAAYVRNLTAQLQAMAPAAIDLAESPLPAGTQVPANPPAAG